MSAWLIGLALQAFVWASSSAGKATDVQHQDSVEGNGTKLTPQSWWIFALRDQGASVEGLRKVGDGREADVEVERSRSLDSKNIISVQSLFERVGQTESMGSHDRGYECPASKPTFRRGDLTPSLQLKAVHVPKAAGTTFANSMFRLACLTGTASAECPECRSPKHYNRAKAVGNCVRFFFTPVTHFAQLETCQPFNTRAACVTSIRDPIDRLVSGWFYHGHHPGLDYFKVDCCRRDRRCNRQLLSKSKAPKLEDGGWSWHWWPVDRTADDGKQATPLPERSATFLDYALFPQYRNIATRMLGDNVHAYAHGVMTDDTSLDLAKRVVRCLDFVAITEYHAPSMLLAAHIFSSSSSRCFDLWDATITGPSLRVNAQVASHGQQGGQQGHLVNSTSAKESLWEKLLPRNGSRTVLDQVEDANRLDIDLYHEAVALFCERWKAATKLSPSSRSSTSCLPEIRSVALNWPPPSAADSPSENSRAHSNFFRRQTRAEYTIPQRDWFHVERSRDPAGKTWSITPEYAAEIREFDEQCFAGRVGWQPYHRTADGELKKAVTRPAVIEE